jgi:hypothetical protein
MGEWRGGRKLDFPLLCAASGRLLPFGAQLVGQLTQHDSLTVTVSTRPLKQLAHLVAVRPGGPPSTSR